MCFLPLAVLLLCSFSPVFAAITTVAALYNGLRYPETIFGSCRDSFSVSPSSLCGGDANRGLFHRGLQNQEEYQCPYKSSSKGFLVRVGAIKGVGVGGRGFISPSYHHF